MSLFWLMETANVATSQGVVTTALGAHERQASNVICFLMILGLDGWANNADRPKVGRSVTNHMR